MAAEHGNVVTCRQLRYIRRQSLKLCAAAEGNKTVAEAVKQNISYRQTLELRGGSDGPGGTATLQKIRRQK